MRSLKVIREEMAQAIYKAKTRSTCQHGLHIYEACAEHGTVVMPCDCYPPPVACPSCGAPMSEKRGSRGSFFSCSGYDSSDPNSCRMTLDSTEAQAQIDQTLAMRRKATMEAMAHA